MLFRTIASLLLAMALTACVTTDGATGGGTSNSGKAKGPRAIVGTWEVSQRGSIFTCKLTVKEGYNRDSGQASPSGCIHFDGMQFINRWERKDGRFEFYAFVNSLAMVARKVDRDEFSGRLQKKDEKVTLIRK